MYLQTFADFEEPRFSDQGIIDDSLRRELQMRSLIVRNGPELMVFRWVEVGGFFLKHVFVVFSLCFYILVIYTLDLINYLTTQLSKFFFPRQ